MLHDRFTRVESAGLSSAASLLASFSRWNELSTASETRLTALVIEELISCRVVLIIIVIVVATEVVAIAASIVVLVIILVPVLSTAAILLIIAVLPAEALLFILLVNLELLCASYKSLRSTSASSIILPAGLSQVPRDLVDVQVLTIGLIDDSLKSIMR